MDVTLERNLDPIIVLVLVCERLTYDAPTAEAIPSSWRTVFTDSKRKADRRVSPAFLHNFP